MIKNEFLIPEYYVNPIPICDDCSTRLEFTGTVYASNPPSYEYICPNCNKRYGFLESEIKGYWRWRTI